MTFFGSVRLSFIETCTVYVVVIAEVSAFLRFSNRGIPWRCEGSELPELETMMTSSLTTIAHEVDVVIEQPSTNSKHGFGSSADGGN